MCFRVVRWERERGGWRGGAATYHPQSLYTDRPRPTVFSLLHSYLPLSASLTPHNLLFSFISSTPFLQLLCLSPYHSTSRLSRPHFLSFTCPTLFSTLYYLVNQASLPTVTLSFLPTTHTHTREFPRSPFSSFSILCFPPFHNRLLSLPSLYFLASPHTLACLPLPHTP